jgi:hypothetical protein
METIHLKTVDPVSQELLRSAARRGIGLSWERHEKLQPQDGFLRLGLSCPYGCMQGPCRIDPFGRGPAQGTCGLGRDDMAAAMLLRLCLQGALEVVGATALHSAGEPAACSPVLQEMMAPLLADLAGQDLSSGDIAVAARVLSRPSGGYQRLLDQALRLSLLTLCHLEHTHENQQAASLSCRVGYGAVTAHPVRIAIGGRVPGRIIEALQQESGTGPDAPVAIVSLGEWLPVRDHFLPLACTSGEAELVVSSGAIHLVLAGSGTDPGLRQLCRHLGIPVVDEDALSEPEEVIRQAREFHGTCSQVDLLPESVPVDQARVLMSADAVGDLLNGGAADRIALVGGVDMPQLSHGQLPVHLAACMQDQGCQVAAWGDAAAWMIKDGLSAADQNRPVAILADRHGPLVLLKVLAASGRRDRLRGICFTGMKSCAELGVALGLAGIGCRVSVAAPVPVHGSAAVSGRLAEKLAGIGGQFMHYAHPVTAEDIAQWLLQEQ